VVLYPYRRSNNIYCGLERYCKGYLNHPLYASIFFNPVAEVWILLPILSEIAETEVEGATPPPVRCLSSFSAANSLRVLFFRWSYLSLKFFHVRSIPDWAANFSAKRFQTPTFSIQVTSPLFLFSKMCFTLSTMKSIFQSFIYFANSWYLNCYLTITKLNTKGRKVIVKGFLY